MRTTRKAIHKRRGRPLKNKERGKWHSFLTDKDGMGQRDFLLVVAIPAYYIPTVLAQLVSLFGVEINDTYISLIDIQQPLAITVVTGVMGAQAVETIGNKVLESRKEKEPPAPYEPTTSEEPQDQYTYEEEMYK